MDHSEHEQRRRFEEAWESVSIARPVSYSLFTFGDSVLPYFLVQGTRDGESPTVVARGEVRIQRPLIITPDTARPEFRDFFENAEDANVASFLMARAAHFSNLKFQNQKHSSRASDESFDAAVDRLNRQLDAEEEDRVAILTSPPNFGGIAVLRYAADRVWRSAPDNIQELRERGFLP